MFSLTTGNKNITKNCWLNQKSCVSVSNYLGKCGWVTLGKIKTIYRYGESAYFWNQANWDCYKVDLRCFEEVRDDNCSKLRYLRWNTLWGRAKAAVAEVEKVLAYHTYKTKWQNKATCLAKLHAIRSFLCGLGTPDMQFRGCRTSEDLKIVFWYNLQFCNVFSLRIMVFSK